MVVYKYITEYDGHIFTIKLQDTNQYLIIGKKGWFNNYEEYNNGDLIDIEERYLVETDEVLENFSFTKTYLFKFFLKNI